MSQGILEGLKTILTPVAVHLGIGLGILYGIEGFFRIVDDKLNDDTKLEVALWLLESESAAARAVGKIGNWPSIFAKLFDRVFGAKHLSWTCFWRSCLASCTLSLVIFVIYVVTMIVSRGWILRVDQSALVALPVFVLIANVLPDYISLLETRYVVKLMARSNSALAWVCWILVDAGLTAYISAVGVNSALGILLAGRHYWVSGSFPHFLLRWLLDSALHPLQMIKAIALGPADLFYSVFFYPAFFTSIWLWLYSGSGLLLKSARRADFAFDWFNRRFDIEKKPVQCVGLVGGVVLAFIYWAYSVWHYFVS